MKNSRTIVVILFIDLWCYQTDFPVITFRETSGSSGVKHLSGRCWSILLHAGSSGTCLEFIRRTMSDMCYYNSSYHLQALSLIKRFLFSCVSLFHFSCSPRTVTGRWHFWIPISVWVRFINLTICPSQIFVRAEMKHPV